MIRIFISHTWAENAAYERFVEMLDGLLGRDNWENVSIPETRRVELFRAHLPAHEQRARELRIALRETDAALNDPNLPVLALKVVYRNGERVELPSRGSVLLQRERLQSELYNVEDLIRAEGHDLLPDPKMSYRSMRMYPELAFSIEEQLERADLVFVLITPLLAYREWVNFELAASARSRVPVIGVRMAENVSPNYRIECRELIRFDPDAVRLSIESVTGGR